MFSIQFIVITYILIAMMVSLPSKSEDELDFQKSSISKTGQNHLTTANVRSGAEQSPSSFNLTFLSKDQFHIAYNAIKLKLAHLQELPALINAAASKQRRTLNKLKHILNTFDLGLVLKATVSYKYRNQEREEKSSCTDTKGANQILQLLNIIAHQVQQISHFVMQFMGLILAMKYAKVLNFHKVRLSSGTRLLKDYTLIELFELFLKINIGKEVFTDEENLFSFMKIKCFDTMRWMASQLCVLYPLRHNSKSPKNAYLERLATYKFLRNKECLKVSEEELASAGFRLKSTESILICDYCFNEVNIETVDQHPSSSRFHLLNCLATKIKTKTNLDTEECKTLKVFPNVLPFCQDVEADCEYHDSTTNNCCVNASGSYSYMSLRNFGLENNSDNAKTNDTLQADSGMASDSVSDFQYLAKNGAAESLIKDVSKVNSKKERIKLSEFKQNSIDGAQDNNQRGQAIGSRDYATTSKGYENGYRKSKSVSSKKKRGKENFNTKTKSIDSSTKYLVSEVSQKELNTFFTEESSENVNLDEERTESENDINELNGQSRSEKCFTYSINDFTENVYKSAFVNTANAGLLSDSTNVQIQHNDDNINADFNNQYSNSDDAIQKETFWKKTGGTFINRSQGNKIYDFKKKSKKGKSPNLKPVSHELMTNGNASKHNTGTSESCYIPMKKPGENVGIKVSLENQQRNLPNFDPLQTESLSIFDERKLSLECTFLTKIKLPGTSDLDDFSFRRAPINDYTETSQEQDLPDNQVEVFETRPGHFFDLCIIEVDNETSDVLDTSASKLGSSHECQHRDDDSSCFPLSQPILLSLPADLQDIVFRDLIKVISSLVVKIIVQCNKCRNNWDTEQCECVTGTGYLLGRSPEIEVPQGSRKGLGSIYIATSNQLVLDNASARNCLVEFSSLHHSFHKGRILRGHSVQHIDEAGEINTYLKCKTHDLQLIYKINAIQAEIKTRTDDLPLTIKRRLTKMAFVIGYSHGDCLTVSYSESTIIRRRLVKEVVEGKEQYWLKNIATCGNDNDHSDVHVLLYTAMTCPGCVGAPILTYQELKSDGKIKLALNIWTHQGVLKTSGFGCSSIKGIYFFATTTSRITILLS
uniref:Uncharacterized protein n=1 Tax=Biomphalaria glabrata TaxID=6526 RepID=A0A2C9LW21_BIOGL